VKFQTPRSRFVVLLLAVTAFRGPAQQIGENTLATGTAATFSASSQLVVETVNVKDNRGKPVPGLTAKDFTVTEDGMPQSIRFFEFQKVPEGAQPEPAITSPPLPFKKLPESQIAAENSGGLRYQDRRLLVFYFDRTAMPPPDHLRAITDAQKFIRSLMTPADRVALMR